MSALGKTHELRQLVDADPTWRLLRADNAPIIVALLGAHLGGENRRLPAADPHSRSHHPGARRQRLRDTGSGGRAVSENLTRVTRDAPVTLVTRDIRHRGRLVKRTRADRADQRQVLLMPINPPR